MAVSAPLLLLADSRLPAGGHAHSGGLEAAATAGRVAGMTGLEGFLRGRLVTAGLVNAGLAAAACQHAAVTAASGAAGRADSEAASEAARGAASEGDAATAAGAVPRWAELDAEAAARTPSPAQRRAARAQGRALLRAARAAWPHPVLDVLAAGRTEGPFHPVVLGACTWVAGGTPADAAAIAATAAITGPASAAVRLLGLDPLAVTGLLARLAGDVAGLAEGACRALGDGDWAALPAPASPGLDLFAQRHALEEVALFES